MPRDSISRKFAWLFKIVKNQKRNAIKQRSILFHGAFDLSQSNRISAIYQYPIKVFLILVATNEYRLVTTEEVDDVLVEAIPLIALEGLSGHQPLIVVLLFILDDFWL